MPSWSQPSLEANGPPAAVGEAAANRAGLQPAQPGTPLRRRFVEALRRAEIISIIAAAGDEAELGSTLAEELCEVYDAELALVAELDGHAGARAIALVGAAGGEAARILASPGLARAGESARAVRSEGADLLGVGARATLLAAYPAAGDRLVVVGAARMYEQPFDEPEAALLEAVALSSGQALERLWAHAERDELVRRLKAALIGTAEALANALEAKDHSTAHHASEVAELAVTAGRELKLTETELEDLRYGAVFHDIGKIAIPDAILRKPGPLTSEERELMKTHPVVGAQIIAPIPFLADAVKEMVRHAHEHFDGSGYPDGLRGEEIPSGSRIILVVDAYHAMRSDRPYQAAVSGAEAMAEIARHSGRQFDPEVVAAFERVMARRG